MYLIGQSPKSQEELSDELKEVKKSAAPASSGSENAEETAVIQVDNRTESVEPPSSASRPTEETLLSEVDNGTESKLKPSSQSHQEEEPQPGPSSAPDVPPVEIEDELHARFEELKQVTSQITSRVEKFVQTLQKVSSFHPTKGIATKAMEANPLLLHAVSRQIPGLLEDMKKSAVSVKYSSEVFRDSRVKLAGSCMDLIGLCDMLMNYVQEAKQEAYLEGVPDKETSKLMGHMDECLGNLEAIKENIKPKMRALEDIIVNPGDVTKEDTERLLGGPMKGQLQSILQPQPPARIHERVCVRKTVFLAVALFFIIIVMFILLGISMLAKNELDALKKLLSEKGKHLAET